MSSNYRTYDYATNIILTSKNFVYGSYRSMKQRHKSSNKKFQPFQIKIIEQQKNKSIISRNDKIDLFLLGGKFSQIKQITMKSRIQRSLYKPTNINKKEQILLPYRSHIRTNNRQISAYITQNENKKTLKAQFLNVLSTSEDTRKKNQDIKLSNQNYIRQKSTQNMTVRIKQNWDKRAKIISPKKKQTIKDMGIIKQQKQYKHSQQKPNENFLTVKATENSENQLQKISKIARPLFYLQAKQISHIKADSFIVNQFPSGQIIFGNYFKKTGQIASLTKIMTFYCVCHIAQKFNKNVYQQKVEIDEEAQSMTGTSAQIFVGDIYTVQQLFYGLMLPSGNDAATALAKWGGKILQACDPSYKTDSKNSQIKTFIKFMNNLAKRCGMKSSKFCNPHGLPHAQSSSNAQDLGYLMVQCLKIDLFHTVIKAKKYNCWVKNDGIKHEVIWENTNKLLRRPNFIGGKTGVTVTAGPCLASCYELDSKIIIVILLRTTKLSRRFKQTRYILGLALSKLDKHSYKQRIRQILKNDPQLDSDNSDDEQQFNYQCTDAKQMAKRNKILTFQM